MSEADGHGLVLLAAGGTGGHLFPAQALAEALGARGYRVALVTDSRGQVYGTSFGEGDVHFVPAATAGGRNPLAYLRAAAVLGTGFVRAWRLIGRLRPSVVAGFGGYPTVPPVLAASLRRVPTLVHDQNAVIGRANRFLARRADVIATSFAQVRGLAERDRGKTVLTGAPVRRAVLEAVSPYAAPGPGGPLRLVVFGGSQGARVFADVVPGAVALLPEPLRARLSIVQQCREEDLARVESAYAAAGVAAELAPFFADLPGRISGCHLVVSRSGASTVAELAVLGRPAILVPLPHAIDNDQLFNAKVMEDARGGRLMPQSEFTPQLLAEELRSVADAPDRLAGMARAAGVLANPHAAERLADVVDALAKGTPVPAAHQAGAPL